MNAHIVRFIILAVIAALPLLQTARADDASSCSLVSGTIAANLTSATTAQGTVTGDLRGSVTASFSATPRENGTIVLSLNHTFVTEAGDMLTTRDTGLLVPVPGAAGVYRMTVQYTITGGTGHFAGASGSLENHGEAALSSTPAQLTLRYSGRVCSAKEE